MKISKLPKVVPLVFVALSAISVRAGQDKTIPPLPGEFIGRVELIPSVPITDGARVLVEGTSLGAKTDESGNFDIRNVPQGSWRLRILYGDLQVSVRAGANPGIVTDVGAIVLSAPGSISGRATLLDGSSIKTAIVGIPALGLYVRPNDAGAYLITGVAPGTREVILVKGDTPGSTPIFRRQAAVVALKLTSGVNLPLTDTNVPTPEIPAKMELPDHHVP
jgi:hypothetical protein